MRVKIHWDGQVGKRDRRFPAGSVPRGEVRCCGTCRNRDAKGRCAHGAANAAAAAVRAAFGEICIVEGRNCPYWQEEGKLL